MGDYNTTLTACEFIKGRIDRKPEVAVICGSGLRKLAAKVTNQKLLSYDEIPGFPTCTVLGHESSFMFGELGGKSVVVMQGRFHPYEGYDYNLIALPIRVMKMLGAETIFITNAAGGLNPAYQPGDMVIIKDHVDFSSIVGRNPLVGPNDSRFGTRFPALIGTYDRLLRDLAKECAVRLGMAKHVKEGVYFHAAGPVYETPATTRMFRSLGCDVEGMSTTQEVMVARHLGMRIFAISLITDVTVADDDNDYITNHDDVLEMARTRALDLGKLLQEMLMNM